VARAALPIAAPYSSNYGEGRLTALSRHSRAASRGSQMRRFRSFTGPLSNRWSRPRTVIPTEWSAPPISTMSHPSDSTRA